MSEYTFQIRYLNSRAVGLKHVGVGDGSDFSVSIQSGGEKQLETLFIDESNCQQKYNKVHFKKNILLFKQGNLEG